MSYSALAFHLAYAKEYCLALAKETTSALLGGGEADLGVG